MKKRQRQASPDSESLGVVEALDGEDDTQTLCTDEMVQSEGTVIGHKESKRVFYTRALVLFVLVSVAAVTSTLVFLYSRQVEEDTFEAEFVDMANKVMSEFVGGAGRRVAAVEGFAIQITSHVNAKTNNAQWPNVALPDFERRARNAMLLSDALSIIFMPIVTKETKDSWEAFSVENVEWLAEGLDYQGIPEEEWLFSNLTVSEQLYLSPESDRDELGPGPYAPWWQFAPAIPYATLINYDAFSHPTRSLALQSVLENKKSLVTRSIDFLDPSEGAQDRLAVLQAFLLHGENDGDYEAGPVADMYVPVFKTMDNQEIAGEITSYVYWQKYFEDILPAQDIGIFVILENTCNQTYTYRIDGSAATYIGQGDLHDKGYEDLGESTDYGSFIGYSGDLHNVTEGQCLYRIRVYPSDKLKESLLSKQPVRFALILAATFLFTSMVFMLYDYLVQRRQEVVMTTAVKSSAVVDSLFPREVRDRLYQEEPTTKRISRTLSPLASEIDHSTSVHDDEDPHAIADLYPNCTVLFCDIVGFTRWSSSREPRDVFKLLETLYKAFDKSAFRMDVFKVETIGDCYVAATGLPLAQKDHAVVMAKFASDCMQKAGKVTHRLSEHLGEDTAKLGIRIGMHSGPVTAGVLRGAKARFQLFGDTVNTASRMESTGLEAKIQISSATADLLCSAGFTQSVVEREHEVEAKGKGKLHTYWLKPISEEGSTTCSSSEQHSHP